MYNSELGWWELSQEELSLMRPHNVYAITNSIKCYIPNADDEVIDILERWNISEEQLMYLSQNANWYYETNTFWHNLCCKYKLPELFIDYYVTRIDWNALLMYQKLDRTILENENYMAYFDWPLLLQY